MTSSSTRQSKWYSLPLGARMALQALMFAASAVVYRYVTSFIWDVPRWDLTLVILLASVGALGAYFDERGRRRIERELDRVKAQSD